MAEQIINLGSSPNDGTGDKLRVAFTKVDHNFGELYDTDRNTSNSIGILSNNANTLANSVNILGIEHDYSSNVANLGFAKANGAYSKANDAYIVAIAAFDKANNALPNTANVSVIKGPYANDSNATSGGVSLNEFYYDSTGMVRIRIS